MAVQILAPAGDFGSLCAAIDNGADAVYFGVGKFNMRSRAAANFSVDDLPEVIRICHAKNVKAWLTLNTAVFDDELEDVRKLCAAAANAGVDAVIAADPAVVRIAESAGLSIHLSVQANITNLESVRFYARYADVMVLARELNLSQIARICRGIREENITGPSGEPVKIEVFIHGALCVAVSGKCYMSLALFNSSANRGDCYQPCRRSYTVRDSVNDQELEIDNHHVMSPSDLCTLEILPRIIDAGVSVLKIEGRGRSADYVAAVTGVYRQAVDLKEKNITPDAGQLEKWKSRLGEVFNRGFWHGGYYLGEKVGEWAESARNKASLVKVQCGRVINYFPKARIAQVQLTCGSVKLHDRFLVTGPTTGAVEGVLNSLRVGDDQAELAEKGMEITFPCENTVRKNDTFFLLTPAH